MDTPRPSDPIYLQRHGAVAELVINAPRQRNALNLAMWAALPALIREAEQHPAINVVILHGGNVGHFAAGADISEFADAYADAAAAARSADIMSNALKALAGCEKPVIAAIEGNCIGGGVSLALACDIRIASDDARFGVTPARLGLVYPGEDTRRLVQAVGSGHASDLLFTGEIINAQRAHGIGLVEHLCPAGKSLQTAQERAELIGAVSQYSVRQAKKMIAAASSRQSENEEFGRDFFLDATAGDDFREGYRAFLEKRKPDFPSSSS